MWVKVAGIYQSPYAGNCHQQRELLLIVRKQRLTEKGEQEQNILVEYDHSFEKHNRVEKKVRKLQ